MHFSRKTTSASVLALLMGACSAVPVSDNLEPVATGGAYQAQYRDFAVSRDAVGYLLAPQINASKCRPFAAEAQGSGGGGKYSGIIPAALRGEVLSRGDLVDFRMPEDTTFTGDYVISRDGTLKLPYLKPVPAQGRSTAQVAADVRRALLAGGYYDDAPDIALLVKDFASARVGVTGAVFEPQPVDIGGVPGDQVDSRRQEALGASTEGRNLSVALRRAGGIRPDADLSAVRITRNGTHYTLDLRGVLEGRTFEDVMLIGGDEIEVPTRLCFQDKMMRPGLISPPGISLYLSNLTQPAAGNAPSAIGQTVREVPYGTRFMQAVIDANCVGGPRASSADRSAALFSRNPMTGVSVVIQRKVETMRSRADRDDYDPYLLPGDAIACYDSGITNISEIARLMALAGAIAVVP
ncbi:polysaccharide biosynthesis/export family protein [Seohaeicola zhoushanensis]|uniref:Polysaccharide biosynthesis protein n=1 Tax=Seohaeicola zhoushanensis TaxID=1569283 RepID=A0A8J3H055_9RHOB|nr:polysaccharide biosynthesis/export family protein [Seohaeicola zhoushanensis]GHF59125.1 hypothetical protein GCM10017056_33280 [Seohaeicola zhoushanensis]